MASRENLILELKEARAALERIEEQLDEDIRVETVSRSTTQYVLDRMQAELLTTHDVLELIEEHHPDEFSKLTQRWRSPEQQVAHITSQLNNMRRTRNWRVIKLIADDGSRYYTSCIVDEGDD
jgi:hypothetical protein